MQIVTRQVSGLGNQLFQYAAGRYYSRLYTAPLLLALDPPERAFSHGSPRPFLLSHFAIQASVRTTSKTELLLLSSRAALRPLLQPMRRALGIKIVREAISQRYTYVETAAPDRWTRTLYLIGYWQNHRIAEALGEDLRTELTFLKPPENANRTTLQQITECRTPVSLHIRRGDYTLAAEGNIALPLDYYAQAIQKVRDQVDDPTFFVFSDDMAFAKAHLPPDLKAVYVNHNDGYTAHEDLRLMSSCQHHVIANSSFSWWGAWLNPHKSKLVWAPRQWLLRPESYFPDLMPPTWELLDVSRDVASAL